jgi:non-canonical poly(A) RNA polymerase PAPD5/7
MDDEFIPFGENSSSSGKSESPTLLTAADAPWIRELVDTSEPPFVRLHNEILEFCEFVALSNEEMRIRKAILAEITELITDEYPSAEVSVFGSQMTKILTPTSDVDIAVLNIEPDKKDVISTLYGVADLFAKNKVASYLEVISTAKVPIVKMDHASSGISVDICVNNSSGIDTGRFIRQHAEEFPPLRPMCIILKIFLAQRRLNETYSGGVGSFVLSAMVLSFLQQRTRLNVRRESKMTWNLGALLLDFFLYYSSTLNHHRVGITLQNQGGYFSKHNHEGDWVNPGRPNLIAIENPLAHDVDMGRNSFMFLKVKRSFEHAYQLLSAAIAEKNVDSHLAFLIRSDDPLLANRSRPWLGESRTNSSILFQDKALESDMSIPPAKKKRA